MKNVFDHLYRYLKDDSILPKFQSGFRPLHLVLIQICDNWFENMDNGKLTGVVFLLLN